MGFGSSFCQIMYAHIKELMPSHMAGTAMTGVNFFTMMGAGIFTHGFGKILDLQFFTKLPPGMGYRMAFFMYFIILLTVVALYIKTIGAFVQK
jgi:hypothetical protein